VHDNKCAFIIILYLCAVSYSTGHYWVSMALQRCHPRHADVMLLYKNAREFVDDFIVVTLEDH
jgi:hypothetical protein